MKKERIFIHLLIAVLMIVAPAMFLLYGGSPDMIMEEKEKIVTSKKGG